MTKQKQQKKQISRKGTFFGQTFFVALGVLLGVSGLFFLSQGASSQENVSYEPKRWIENQIQELVSLTFMSSGTVTPETGLILKIADYNKSNDGLLNAQGTMNVGENNLGAIGNTLLGGKGNLIDSVVSSSVILGGENNATHSSHSQAFGGIVNSLGSDASFSFIGGGRGNNLGGISYPSAHSALLGGENNSLEGKHTLVLGMKNNDVMSDNSLVMGSNVHLTQNNAFVWNDGESVFSPQQGNAFFIQSKNGVGINTTDPKVTLDVNGGIKIGSPEPVCNSKSKGAIYFLMTGDVEFTGKDLGCFCGCNGVEWVGMMEETMEKCTAACNNKLRCPAGYEPNAAGTECVVKQLCHDCSKGFPYCFPIDFSKCPGVLIPTCGKPTISNVTNANGTLTVSFALGVGSPVTVGVYVKSADQTSWSASHGATTSPRTFTISGYDPSKTYQVKIEQYCSASSTTSDVSVVCGAGYENNGGTCVKDCVDVQVCSQWQRRFFKDYCGKQYALKTLSAVKGWSFDACGYYGPNSSDRWSNSPDGYYDVSSTCVAWQTMCIAASNVSQYCTPTSPTSQSYSLNGVLSGKSRCQQNGDCVATCGCPAAGCSSSNIGWW